MQTLKSDCPCLLVHELYFFYATSIRETTFLRKETVVHSNNSSMGRLLIIKKRLANIILSTSLFYFLQLWQNWRLFVFSCLMFNAVVQNLVYLSGRRKKGSERCYFFYIFIFLCYFDINFLGVF